MTPSPTGANETEYREARRELTGWTAGVEKRALAWLAARLPAFVTPDHLTAVGLVAMLLGGAAYAGSGRYPSLLWAVNLALADGRIRPVVDKVFPLSDLPAAKAYMESDAQVGKIVVTAG